MALEIKIQVGRKCVCTAFYILGRDVAANKSLLIKLRVLDKLADKLVRSSVN